MNPKIPGSLIGVGFAFEEITVIAKKVPWLYFLGRSDWFQWGLATLAAVTLSYGIFLSLYGLSRCSTIQRRVFASIHILGLVVFGWAVGTLIGGYVVFSKVNSLEIPNMIPKLVESSQKADSIAKREKIAQNAYKVYGVTLAYPADGGQWIKYVPTAEDTAFHEKFARDDVSNQRLKESIIGGQLRQLPFLIAMNLGIFMLTFLVGALWLACRKLPV